MSDTDEFTVKPIGIIHTIYSDKAAAPRQPGLGAHSVGEILLYPDCNYEQALEDLEGFERVWILFWFHLNSTWKPKVLPPRSRKKRGVFATRSPHRPNPIGLSLCRLLEIRGRRVMVENPDLLDGTPVIDIKPYIPYVEACPGSRTGWLEAEENNAGSPYRIEINHRAQEQAKWLNEAHGIDVLSRAMRTLARDPWPHPYKRISAVADGRFVLAVKSWRIRYRLDGRRIVVDELASGYSAAAIAAARENGDTLHDGEAHAAFHRRWPDH